MRTAIRPLSALLLTLELRSPGGEKLPTSMMIGMAGTVSITTLKRMASARSVGGNALRLDFELGDAQRDAVARFTERVLSEDPALLSGLR